MRDRRPADEIRREDQPPAVADRAAARAAAPARDRIADADPGRRHPGQSRRIRAFPASSSARASAFSQRSTLPPRPSAGPPTNSRSPSSVTRRGRSGDQSIRRSTPRNGIGAPAAIGSAAAARPAARRSSPAAPPPRPARGGARRGAGWSARPCRCADRRRAASAAPAPIGRNVTATPPTSASELTIDQMMLELAGLVLGHRPAAHRHAGLVDRLAIAADQIMPVEQRLVVGAQAIGAGRGQPVDSPRLPSVSRTQSGTCALRLR